MSEFTEGPWVVNNDADPPHVSTEAPDTMGNIICEAPVNWDLSMSAWEANARLIAAAPELLEACRQALIDPNWIQIRAAITKATGETS